MIKKFLNCFSINERILWISSVGVIVVSFALFGSGGYITLIASLIGVTSLILNSKGNPAGQALMIIFSLIYGYISFSCRYFGEMLTYVGMTAPMALFSLISWLRHPYNGNRSEVKVNVIEKKEYILLAALTVIVTAVFFFILKYFNTANLFVSTVSVITSFIAVYLTFRRSPYYAIGYAANDVVLIVLWLAAMKEDISYLSVLVCFAAFLINDIYGYISWKSMEAKQK